MELLYELNLNRTMTVGAHPMLGSFGLSSIISSGDPMDSVLYYRIAALGSAQMPRVGRNLVDEKGLKLIHDWIQALPVGAASPVVAPPWASPVPSAVTGPPLLEPPTSPVSL